MKSNRRTFLQKAGTLGAGTAVFALGAPLRAAANERFTLGVIGPGGMGMNLLQSFVSMPDVKILAVCDPDRNRAAAAGKAVEQKSGTAPQVHQDFRRVLELKEVDAVVIATPDHWHAPATILACEAGKHVYVEKPCSHNLREGRLMIEAARRHKRVVQTGTQSRSAEHVIRAMDRLRNGAIGEVLVAKAWNSQLRSSIGRAQPSAPPAHLDFDLWLGPAPKRDYQSNLLHSIWRWWYDFGCGDIGNDGVHDIDIARWGLAVTTHPRRIVALGGKYFFDDDQQWPDTQQVTFEYAPEGKGRPKMLVFEQRIWSPYVQEGQENGNAFYGTKGMMILGKQNGWQIFGSRNHPGEKMTSGLDSQPHHRNFLECIRSGNLPNADVEIGHLSASLCHLGNIATRVGRVLNFDPANESIRDDPEAGSLLKRKYRDDHWAVPKTV